MKLNCLAPLIALVAASVATRPALADGGRVPVTDVRVLMIAAIDSPTGTAQGVLTSKDAESITKHFKATGPILIDVSTVKRYAQAGCARLKLSFAQDGVQLPGQATPRETPSTSASTTAATASRPSHSREELPVSTTRCLAALAALLGLLLPALSHAQADAAVAVAPAQSPLLLQGPLLG
jgi:hypothetical protein